MRAPFRAITPVPSAAKRHSGSESARTGLLECRFAAFGYDNGRLTKKVSRPLSV
jgi:hypothetical protein